MLVPYKDRALWPRALPQGLTTCQNVTSEIQLPSVPTARIDANPLQTISSTQELKEQLIFTCYVPECKKPTVYVIHAVKYKNEEYLKNHQKWYWSTSWYEADSFLYPVFSKRSDFRMIPGLRKYEYTYEKCPLKSALNLEYILPVVKKKKKKKGNISLARHLKDFSESFYSSQKVFKPLDPAWKSNIVFSSIGLSLFIVGFYYADLGLYYHSKSFERNSESKNCVKGYFRVHLTSHLPFWIIPIFILERASQVMPRFLFLANCRFFANHGSSLVLDE